MKKLKIISSIGFAACIFAALLMLTSCFGKGVKTPTNIKVDLDHNLTWNEVSNARIYNLEIKDLATGETLTKQTRKETYSLASLAEGAYEIRVRALGGDDESSEWSEPFHFDRPYETGCIYELVNNSEYHIVKAGRAIGKIFIEDSYRGKPVTAIADSAFKNNTRVTDVVVGSKVTYIGEKAFYNCRSLVSITNLDSVETIGKSAFQGCSALKEFAVPEKVTVIDEFMFAYCRSLEKIDLGSNVTTIGYSAFSDCELLSEVTIPDSVISLGAEAFMGAIGLEKVQFGKGLEEIGDHTFYLCSKLSNIVFAEENNIKKIGSYAFSNIDTIESITLPDGLEEIGSCAFAFCNALTSVEIPESVSSVGYNAFYASKLYIDQFAAGLLLIYVDDWLVDCNPLVKTGFQLEEGGKVTRYVGLAVEEDFSQIDVNETAEYTEVLISLKENTVGIAEDALYGCAHLKIVILPESVKYVGDGAFEYCSALWKLVTTNVKRIGTMAFYKTALSNVHLGEGLERIDNYAFYESKIPATGFKLPDSLKSIGNEAFNKTPLFKVKDSYGVIYADKWVVGQNLVPKIGADDSVSSDVILKEGTVGIADYAFYSDMATGNITGMFLSSLSGTENLKYIGRSAFYSCIGLASIKLCEEMEYIDEYAFYMCINLCAVDLPQSLKSVGRSAFYNCALTQVDFSECTQLETIDKYAFFGCYELKEVNFGENSVLKEIGDFAFYQSAIENLVLPDSLTKLGVRSFYRNEALKSVVFGSGLTSINEYAFSSCGALESIILPENIKHVAKNAFYNCKAVKTIDLGGVEVIDKYAFFGLEGLEELIVPETVTHVGPYAFKGAGYVKETKEGKISYLLLDGDYKIDAHSFYGLKTATIYTTKTEQPENWNVRWNSSYRPVIWGCEVKEDANGKYVYSVTISENSISNTNAKGGITGPERSGYTFKGWATAENGAVVYSADKIAEAPKGTVLYAVWDADEE